MGYKMMMYVSGTCPDSGNRDATGAAACFTMGKNGPLDTWTCGLPPSSPPLTEIEAALRAITIALERGWKRWWEFTNSKPCMNVQIFTDSDAAFEIMACIKYTHCSKDLVKRYGDFVTYAHALHDRLAEKGDVEYVLLSRVDNRFAFETAKNCLDEMRQEASGQRYAVRA